MSEDKSKDIGIKLKNGKVLLITNNDLDGFSCFIITKFYVNDVELAICDLEEAQDKIQKISMYEDLSNYDLVIISGLSLPLELVKEFNKYCKEDGTKLYIVDHHKESIKNGLDKLKFAKISAESCSTELLSNIFKSLGGNSNNSLEQYIELVKQSKIIEEGCSSKLAKEINALYSKICNVEFYKKFMTKILGNEQIKLDENERKLLKTNV